MYLYTGMHSPSLLRQAVVTGLPLPVSWLASPTVGEREFSQAEGVWRQSLPDGHGGAGPTPSPAGLSWRAPVASAQPTAPVPFPCAGC